MSLGRVWAAPVAAARQASSKKKTCFMGAVERKEEMDGAATGKTIAPGKQSSGAKPTAWAGKCRNS
ncbi:hypothetical protein GCM10027345_44060 [Hymenobacter daeguensis]